MGVFLAELETVVEEGWAQVHRGRFWPLLRERGLSPQMYQTIMTELFHYTRHNSINQAFAAWKVDASDIGLLRFCYDHAAEELGHEKMVEKDLASAGLLTPGLLERAPLPPTQALIGYLYYVGLAEGAVPRLGYSFWAETSYGHIAELLQHMRDDLNLQDRQMTFFVAHAAIDNRHAKQVRGAVSRFATTSMQQQRVMQVARTTLYLTGQILETIADAFEVATDRTPAFAVSA